MKISYYVGLLLILGMVIAIGCEKKGPTASDREKLAATVEDWRLSKDEVEKVLKQLAPSQQVKFDSPAGRVELTNRIIEEELYHQEALKLKLDQNEDVKKRIDDAVRRILIEEYYRKYVRSKARPTDEEMHDFYEEHKNNYMVQPIIKAQHIFSKDREKLVELKKRIENGEKMTALANKYSEDELTRPDGGNLGYFNPGGYIRFIGYSKKFSDAVFALEPGVVSDPIEFEKGYSIVRISEKRPGRLKTYEEVKKEIEDLMIRDRIDEAKDKVFSELKERYKVRNYLEEELRSMQRSAEELWNLAQTSNNSFQRLQAYKEIYEKFPNSDYAPQALFMLGFVYAEELNDKYQSQKAFYEVTQRYPGTDIAKSAKWMIKNYGKPIPDFEDLDELNRKISDKKR